ncbi:hypothetical protein GINT2_002087 [Glugoides intestinalis]
MLHVKTDSPIDTIIEDNSSIGILAEKYLCSSQIDDETDTWLCKCFLTALKHDQVDCQTILKLVAFVTSRFADSRESFNDRACFIATALFKKDQFNARERLTFPEFHTYLSLPERKKPQISRFLEVENTQIQLNHDDYKKAGVFDSIYNPMYLPRALKLLKEGVDKKAVYAVHADFKGILHRTTPRVFKAFSNILFEQLTSLTNSEFYDVQFQSLALLMERDTSYYNKAIIKFKNSKSDVLRTFLVYSFNFLHEIVDFKRQVEIHVEFAEILLLEEIEIDAVGRSTILSFVEKGMKLLEAQQ